MYNTRLNTLHESVLFCHPDSNRDKKAHFQRNIMYQKETPLLNLLDSYMFYSFSSTSSVLLCCAVAEGWSGVE